MLKKITFIAAALILVAACQQKPADTYTVSGVIDGLRDGARVQLVPVSHFTEQPLADTVAAGGKFVFVGVAPEARAVRLMADSAFAGFLMLENGRTNISAKVRQRGRRTDISDYKVTGSPSTDYYLKLYSVRDSLNSLYDAKNERFKDIMEEMGKARGAKDKSRLDSIQATDEYKALEQAETDFFKQVSSAYHRVVEENKETFWGPLMMITLMTYLKADSADRAWYETLSDSAKSSYYGRQVHREVYPVGKEGSPVPPFTVTGADGNELSLTALCANKKYILLDFWASWCAPCRREIPNLKREYARFAAKGFEIVSISIDKQRSDWEKALAEERLPWPNFLDVSGIADDYGVRLIPTTYLIDSKGIIISENLRSTSLATKLEELLPD